MEEHIEFNFIYSNDALRVKTFLGNVPRSIECINYMDIFNKLTKNDFYQYEPSDAVVSSYLMRQLQNAIGRNISTTIFYVLGNLNKDPKSETVFIETDRYTFACITYPSLEGVLNEFKIVKCNYNTLPSNSKGIMFNTWKELGSLC